MLAIPRSCGEEEEEGGDEEEGEEEGEGETADAMNVSDADCSGVHDAISYYGLLIHQP